MHLANLYSSSHCALSKSYIYMGNVIILVYFMTDVTTHYNWPSTPPVYLASLSTYIAVRIVRVLDLHLYMHSVVVLVYPLLEKSASWVETVTLLERKSQLKAAIMRFYEWWLVAHCNAKYFDPFNTHPLFTSGKKNFQQ